MFISNDIKHTVGASLALMGDALSLPFRASGSLLMNAVTPIHDNQYESTLAQTAQATYRVAKGSLGLLASTLFFPLWCVGDLTKGTGKLMLPLPREGSIPRIAMETPKNYQVNPKSISLNPEKTALMGVALSTYQNKKDSQFASQSNWGNYEKTLFTEAKGNADLAPGKGADILTQEGLELVCKKVKEANGNAVRFSIEWAALKPSEEVPFDEEIMGKYLHAIRYMKQEGLTPFVTLHHFVDPLWFTQKGGFESKKNIPHFVQYAEYVFDKIGSEVDHICTFNEPGVVATMGNILGDFPPAKKARFWTHAKVTANLMEAHAQTYDALKKKINAASLDTLPNKGEIQIGFTHQAIMMQASSQWNLIARVVAYVMTYFFHESVMQLTEKHKDKTDFIGVQYYSRPLIGGFPPDSIAGKNETMVTAMKFRFDPSGIYQVLKEVHKRTHKPMYVTETGTAGDTVVNEPDSKDRGTIDYQRAQYYAQSLRAVRYAQDKGMPIKGYFPWTLFGNYEWNHGYSNKHDFGLVSRDKNTGEMRDTDGYKAVQTIFGNTVAKQKELEAQREKKSA